MFILLLLVVFSDTTINRMNAENGQLNLRHWDFDTRGTAKLDGQWEFYWRQLLTYDDFQNNKVPEPVIVPVPKAWTEYDTGYQFSGEGFATYRLHVRTSLERNKILSLKLDNFSSAYKLFINDKEIASNGIVATGKESYMPKYKPVVAVFNVPADEFDIVIQIANFDFYKGGFWNSITLGSVEGIQSLHDHKFGKELFIFGALLLTALYYFSIFITIRSARLYLYFSIACILAIFTFDFLGENLLCRMFDDIPFGLVIFGWYNSIQWLPFVFILYVGEMFRIKNHKVFVGVFGASNVLLTLISIVTPIHFYTQYGRLGDCILLLEVAYSIVLAVYGLKQKKQGAALYILATGVLLITALHDFLLISNIISSSLGQITFMGIFLLLFVHTVIHAKISGDEYNEKARLLTEVQNSRQTAVANERKFLLAQIKPHFICNALSVIASVCIKNPNEAQRLVVSLGDYLRNSFDFSYGDDLVPISKEIELVEAYVDIEKARFGERIKFELNRPDDLNVSIPRLSIQPLVENAFRHGILKKARGGQVTLNIWTEQQMLKIEVADDGFGIPANMVKELMGESESVKGVGVKNIHSRLVGLYGKGLYIKSEPGRSTIFGFEIPI